MKLYIRQFAILTSIFMTVLLNVSITADGAEYPSFATGIKIGEVSDTEAIVWVRLTATDRRMGSDRPWPKMSYWNPATKEWEVGPQRKREKTPKVDFIEGSTIHTIEGAVQGKAGQARLRFQPENSNEWQTTGWHDVDPAADFTHQFRLERLEPGTIYNVVAESKNQSQFTGSFRTAVASGTVDDVTFMVSTGQAYIDIDLPDEGYKIYPSMLKKKPDFFVHTGDILYYDDYAKTKELAWWHWQRMYSLPTNVEFHRQVPSYFIKDDHDTWMNDSWPGQESPYMGLFTQEEGIEIFKQQVPMGDKTYRTFRWGKDLQVWLVEGRDYRSPNPMPDGPDKTIWGKEQIEWFKRTVKESDASFRVLISPTPVVGPDRPNKRDNHSNKVFAHEGNMLRDFLSEQKNMVVVCGDRHWQYISKDPKTGLKEYSCGPASDSHAGGWKQSDTREMHEYLNVTGGFMAVTTTRENNVPVLITRHYNVDGDLLNEDRFTGN